MRVNFSLEQIFGRKPREVDQLFRAQGLDPERPYRSIVSFSGIVIEQDVPVPRDPVAESVNARTGGF